MKRLLIPVILALTGCAVCERHPTACVVGAGILVASVAATVELHHHHEHPDFVRQHTLTPCQRQVVIPTTTLLYPGECQ